MELIFYKAKGDWLDWAIRCCTCGPYSHCELRLESQLTFSSSWRDGGVRFRDMPRISDNWDRLIFDLDANTSDSLFTWCAQQSGKYDMWGVLGLVFGGTRLEDKTKWYCSEICAVGLGGNLQTDLPRYVSPNKLYELCLQMPQRFRRPVIAWEPFASSARYSRLAEARSLVRSIEPLPPARQQAVLAKLSEAEPVVCAIAKSLHNFRKGCR